MSFGERKSLEQMEEEEQRLQHQLSMEQRKALIKELKKRGGEPDHYKDPRTGGMDWDAMKFRVGGKFSK